MNFTRPTQIYNTISIVNFEIIGTFDKTASET